MKMKRMSRAIAKQHLRKVLGLAAPRGCSREICRAWVTPVDEERVSSPNCALRVLDGGGGVSDAIVEQARRTATGHSSFSSAMLPGKSASGLHHEGLRPAAGLARRGAGSERVRSLEEVDVAPGWYDSTFSR